MRHLCWALLALPLAASPLAYAASARGAVLKATKPSAQQRQLEQFAHGLRGKDAQRAYLRLSAFARRRSSGPLARRAALALGLYDDSNGRYPQAHAWLEMAKSDSLLREYALYEDAGALLALGQASDAVSELELFRRQFPQSVLRSQALHLLAEAALAAGEPQRALLALQSEARIDSHPGLLFLRGQAEEQAGENEAAARDYLDVYYRFPLSPAAEEAEVKAETLRAALGEKFPAIPPSQRLARAETLYAAGEWRAALEEYEKSLPELSGPYSDRARLREAQCRVVLGAPPSTLADFALVEPELDAERLYSLSQAYRAVPEEAEMLAAIEQAVVRAPESVWAEQALFSAGNYFWIQLDRGRASRYYQRLLVSFPAGKDAAPAHWRIAWAAYLERRPEAAGLFEEHLGRFPDSSFMPDALYWLGKLAGCRGDISSARAYFGKLEERFPQTYFGGLAAARLRVLGKGLVANLPVLDSVVPPPPALSLTGGTPSAAAARIKRAEALRSIAFDSSAELEYRAAYAETGAAEFLLEAAEAAIAAERYAAAMGIIRQIVPELDARHFRDVRDAAWKTAYPLPYRNEIHRRASRARLDPMLLAGLIRQESAFDPEATSRAGALGLMQLLPQTSQKIARQLRVRYSRVRLFDPEYNLRLGTAYLAELRSGFGSLEAALAAYNAGEDRVAAWQTGQKYEDMAEFVESIPFTETREYVQIVMRNAAIYRKLYGGRR